MKVPRTVLVIYTVGLVIALVGGALLWVHLHATATRNSHFICAFGSAISAQPLKPRNAETPKEFRQRVTATKKFVAELEDEFDDCQQPPVIVVREKGREVLEKARERPQERHRAANRRSGGDSSSTAPPSSQPPPPPSGGGGSGGGTPDPPRPPNPPDDPPRLLDPACDLVNELGMPLC